MGYRRRLLGTLAGIACAFGAVAPAFATRGVAVDLGAIAIDEPLDRGASYSLPTLGVRNPGTERATYRMAIGPITGKHAPDQSWFSFQPAEFTLAPGDKQAVAIRIAVPANADPVAYESLLEATLVLEGQGAQVGAAAGARLSFTVRESTGIEALLRQGIDLLDRWMPWSLIVPILVLVALVLRWASKRFSLRLERRR